MVILLIQSNYNKNLEERIDILNQNLERINKTDNQLNDTVNYKGISLREN